MTLTRVAMLVGVALAVLVVNVLVSFVYMAVYGHLIDPGHENAYYEAHAQRVVPWCGLLVGIPLVFFAGWWVGGWDPKIAVTSALVVWLVCAISDVVALVAWGMTARAAAFVAASLVTKLVAAYAGASMAVRAALD
jgi:hypothetical protein